MATATRKRTAAKKTTAKRTPKPKPSTVGKGRTSKALKNRYDWQANPEMLSSMIAAVDNAPRGSKQAVFEDFAKKVGNGIGWKSVRAIYYQYGGTDKTGTSKGEAKAVKAATVKPAGKLPTDPVARVRAIVSRRGQLSRAQATAERELARVTEQQQALAERKSALTDAIKAAKAEVKELDAKLAGIA